MIHIAPLNADLLTELGRELGGCNFSDENQKDFLTCAGSCDVQAAPGNGKTTLLVAKLAVLSRTWTARTQGVCVISHTNAAREEVETKLSMYPAGLAFLDYPHFIGTVTAFVDRFFALPYLRGLGWPIHRIDNDVFEAVARGSYSSKRKLWASVKTGKRKHQVEGWIARMELSPTFECNVGIAPDRLKIRDRGNRQPGPQSDSGMELEELKAEMVNAGLYRFGDMTVLAQQAIEKYPALIDRIRKRFPLVLLDEAQDTHGDQLEFLSRIFGEGVAYQRLGDQNQTLYEDPEVAPDAYWQADANVIPLNVTRRFGPEIAAFASRLAVRRAQQIQGSPDKPSRRSLFLFDQSSISCVLPAYAADVKAHWGERFTASLNVWAVASRHNLYRDPTGCWLKSLVDYCPDYRAGTGRQRNAERLCTSMRQACALYKAQSSPAEVAQLMRAGIATLLQCDAYENQSGRKLTSQNLWSVLSLRDPASPLKVRRLLRDRILHGDAIWNREGWKAFCNDLRTALGIAQPPAPPVAKILQFDTEGALDQRARAPQPSTTIVVHEGVTVRLGSIHSVKGRTVDSILIVETEVWRSQARADRAMDLETVLPHAFRVEDRDFGGNEAHLAAATNVFVAATRPRYLLACALRKEAASDRLVDAARTQGWRIFDLATTR